MNNALKITKKLIIILLAIPIKIIYKPLKFMIDCFVSVANSVDDFILEFEDYINEWLDKQR